MRLLPRDPRARVALLIGAGLLAFTLVLAVIDRLTPSPTGPASSSYATAPDGLAAYADVLRRAGHPVRRIREAPTDRVLDPRETLVVLDPRNLLPEESEALGRFVGRGGHLVAGGTDPGGWLEGVIADAPVWRPGGEAAARPLVPAPETAQTRVIRGAGDGHWRELGGALPLLGPADRPPVVALSFGRGRLVLLADASPLQNRLLAQADNAAFAAGLAGRVGRPVAFLESVHGFGTARGLAAIPGRWRWGLALLGLAALCLLASRARRLGPAEDAARELPPPRAAYVDAVAAALARTAAGGPAPAPLLQAARERLTRRAAGLAAEPGEPGALRAAAAHSGLDARETAAVVDGQAGEDAAMIVAGALAKLEGGTR